MSYRREEDRYVPEILLGKVTWYLDVTLAMRASGSLSLP